MIYQPMGLRQSHGFSAQVVASHPHVAVLTAPVDTSREEYHDVLKELAAAGVRRVVVDVSGVRTPSRKLAYAYLKPTAEDVPGIELNFIAGITRDEIFAGANSEHTARSLATSLSFKPTIDEAVDECLR